MKEFFKVISLADAFNLTQLFSTVETETVTLHEATGRILAVDILGQSDLPAFPRSTMDGYAVKSSSTFGASDANPAYLNVVGEVQMGESATVTLQPGQACRITTGGMLPQGADGVLMVEYTEEIDEQTIEAYRSVAPGQHVLNIGEDVHTGQRLLSSGQLIRPQETGLLAAQGIERVSVFKKPVIGIISTGDEIVPVSRKPKAGQIRDVNTYTLGGYVSKFGGIPVSMGIVKDDFQALKAICMEALGSADMILLSGGSSVGTRDYTIEVLRDLPDVEILFHGVSIRPGKPTILAKASNKPVWGLPGQVTSAMVVFHILVQPFFDHIAGLTDRLRLRNHLIQARLNRNLASAQGRTDFVRVRLGFQDGQLWAEPLLGKSGLISTMVDADGLVEIDANTEGIDRDTIVSVTLI